MKTFFFSRFRTVKVRFGRCVAVLCVIGAVGATTPERASAQITDPRVMQLEEQLRQLTGRMEELNFQILQLQEQLRRQQEDYEFRFQQLEDGGFGEAAPQEGRAEVPPPRTEIVEAPKADRIPVAPPQTDGTGAPPRSLGTLTLDPDGAVVDAEIDFSDNAVGAAIDGAQVASITGAMDPEELYRTGYSHVLNGDYALAEQLFASFIELYPNDLLVADARFWLGESVLAQGRYEDAAQIFIDTRSRHPDAQKAPETMLKIGTIMAALGNRDVACVTLADALGNHTDMNPNLRQRIVDERAKARC